ncbi:rRNA biogenesis protein rrp5 [Megasphaera elsdenii]|uniref:rRNA biogenesis protein rrp5 n=1 Tax=Megasphaera elsdenii TaxID=907 RepID=UPI001D0289CD|nr:rRNA biogenesis protein rrp5 [Megasphaera elsdenii]MCB5702403.1 rRNA biogenesis protein rrp5 [Megasphaera elsdenii]MCB5727186.1 rRNA biogenesis protein rrp5 [Megasphaera elsdenii]MCB5770966.1 rRNA biogenesis protein rrp5 [Megasphaera elsdenii]
MTSEETARQVAQLLHAAADSINQAADKVAQIVEMEKGQEVKANRNEQSPQLTLEGVRKVAADKSRQGFTDEVRSLIQKYGADKLSGINTAQYEAFLKELEAIGHAR